MKKILTIILTGALVTGINLQIDTSTDPHAPANINVLASAEATSKAMQEMIKTDIDAVKQPAVPAPAPISQTHEPSPTVPALPTAVAMPMAPTPAPVPPTQPTIPTPTLTPHPIEQKSATPEPSPAVPALPTAIAMPITPPAPIVTPTVTTAQTPPEVKPTSEIPLPNAAK